MRALLSELWRLGAPDARSDHVVPPTGFTVRLTVAASALLAFLAVFALAFAVAANRLADRWDAELAGTGTVRVSAPAGQMEAQVAAALRVLEQTPGVAGARALDDADQAALLEPFLGPDLPLADLALPRLIEFREVPPGYDATGLRLRLEAEVPGAVLDDHARWRAPLVDAAERLRTLGVLSIVLIGVVVGALITLAAGSALAANREVIAVLRLVGARDRFIAGAFVRRFTLRALAGASLGAVVAMVVVAALPDAGEGFLTGLGFQGAEWVMPLALPPLAGIVAFAATRAAAFRALKELR